MSDNDTAARDAKPGQEVIAPRTLVGLALIALVLLAAVALIALMGGLGALVTSVLAGGALAGWAFRRHRNADRALTTWQRRHRQAWRAARWFL